MRGSAFSALIPLTCLAICSFVCGQLASPKRRLSVGAIAVGNRANKRYAVTINVSGQDVAVVLDTGSSDLWINTPHIPSFQHTDIGIVSLGYGDKSFNVEGPVGIAPVSLGDSQSGTRFSLDEQAFIVADTLDANELAELEIYGILGLGIDFHSRVLRQMSKASGAAANGQSGRVKGHTFLQNIFDQRPSLSRFFALELSRIKQGATFAAEGGSLWIGEHNPLYAPLVANAPRLPVFPEESDHWTVLFEGLSVGGSAIPLHTFGSPDVPTDRVTALLDSGAPHIRLPPLVSREYHSKIPGAMKGSDGAWIVPCKMRPVVTVQLGGRVFPLHPLDVITQVDPLELSDGRTATVCLSAFRDLPDYHNGRYDVILGVQFLRNVYSVFNTGDQPNGKPYIQLVSTLGESASEPKQLEIPPAELVRLRDLASRHKGLFDDEVPGHST